MLSPSNHLQGPTVWMQFFATRSFKKKTSEGFRNTLDRRSSRFDERNTNSVAPDLASPFP